VEDQQQLMFLDWLLKTEEDNISYDEINMLAQDRLRFLIYLVPIQDGVNSNSIFNTRYSVTESHATVYQDESGDSGAKFHVNFGSGRVGSGWVTTHFSCGSGQENWTHVQHQR